MISNTIFDGIVWTAIRDMMVSPQDFHPSRIDAIKRISHIMDIKERRHQAGDIRRNIEWNSHYPWNDDPDIAEMWSSLAIWLENGKSHPAPEPFPQDSVSCTWFSFVRHSLHYIIHRHTYASSYANDIARLWPMLNAGQRSEIHEYLAFNVLPDDDEDVRRLAAYADPDNRWMVRSKATKKQINEWIKANNVISDGVHKSLDVQTLCFKFDGKYLATEDYGTKNPGYMIPEFITNITHQPQ